MALCHFVHVPVLIHGFPLIAWDEAPIGLFCIRIE